MDLHRKRFKPHQGGKDIWNDGQLSFFTAGSLPQDQAFPPRMKENITNPPLMSFYLHNRLLENNRSECKWFKKRPILLLPFSQTHETPNLDLTF